MCVFLSLDQILKEGRTQRPRASVRSSSVGPWRVLRPQCGSLMRNNTNAHCDLWPWGHSSASFPHSSPCCYCSAHSQSDSIIWSVVVTRTTPHLYVDLGQSSAFWFFLKILYCTLFIIPQREILFSTHSGDEYHMLQRPSNSVRSRCHAQGHLSNAQDVN